MHDYCYLFLGYTIGFCLAIIIWLYCYVSSQLKLKDYMRIIKLIAPIVIYALVAFAFYKYNEDILDKNLLAYLTPVSTIAATLVALFKDRYSNFIDKPILTLCKSKENDFLSSNPTKNKDFAVITVKNEGKSIAKNVFAQIELIKSSDGFDQDYEMPRMNLRLAYHANEKQKCDIYPDLKEVFDVLYIDDNNVLFLLTTSIEGNEFPLDKVKLTFKLTIGADNANFIIKKLIVDTVQDPARIEIESW